MLRIAPQSVTFCNTNRQKEIFWNFLVATVEALKSNDLTMLWHVEFIKILIDP